MSQLNLSVGNDHLFVSETTLPVMVTHLNGGKHLPQESILILLQEARAQYLFAEGMAEAALAGPVGLLVSQVNLDYHAQAFYGDELRIQIYASRFTKRARLFSFNYRVIRVSDDAIIADAATEHVFYDYQARRVTTAPSEFYWLIHRNLQLISLAA